MNNKKAFTLIEIILALILASIASMYVIKTLSKNDFTSELIKFQDNLQSLIEDGIISPSGYASGGGGNCSTGMNFLGLDAQTLTACLQSGGGWRDINSSGTGNTSFIEGQNYMRNYGGCNVQTMLDTNDASNRSFFVYVDCANINYDDSIRARSRIESAIKFTFLRKLEYMTSNIDDDSMSINNDTGGDANDGRIRVRFTY